MLVYGSRGPTRASRSLRIRDSESCMRRPDLPGGAPALNPEISPPVPTALAVGAQRPQRPAGFQKTGGTRLFRIFRTISHTSPPPDLEIPGDSLRTLRPLLFTCIP